MMLEGSPINMLCEDVIRWQDEFGFVMESWILSQLRIGGSREAGLSLRSPGKSAFRLARKCENAVVPAGCGI